MPEHAKTRTAEPARLERIVSILRVEGPTRTSVLKERLDVSADTIRRDLKKLVERNEVEWKHTYTQLVHKIDGYSSSLPAFAHKMVNGASIIHRVAQFIRDTQLNGEHHLIILDGGESAPQIARHLPPDSHGTIVTNSPSAAVELESHANIKVNVIGGRLQEGSLLPVGLSVYESLRLTRANLCVLGLCKIHPETGISVDDEEEAQLKRAMVDCASEIAAIATPETLGSIAPHIVASLSKPTYLFVDDTAPEEALAPFVKAQVKIMRSSKDTV
jgi:DeoR/GlpR family transcriptional regulator of sugar metabolism